MLFDSNFMIHAGGQRGRASHTSTVEFLAAHQDSPLYTSRVCWSEFAEGCDHAEEVHRALARFTIIEITEAVAWEASRISRDLDRRGLHIGDNDVWIAATALAYRLPLVSRNARHFKRVAGLDAREY